MAVRVMVINKSTTLNPFSQFHSDAEAGLGPLVAGLSLGAPAFMHFRRVPKTKEALDGQKGILLSFKLEHVSPFSPRLGRVLTTRFLRATSWSWTALGSNYDTSE